MAKPIRFKNYGDRLRYVVNEHRQFATLAEFKALCEEFPKDGDLTDLRKLATGCRSWKALLGKIKDSYQDTWAPVGQPTSHDID